MRLCVRVCFEAVLYVVLKRYRRRGYCGCEGVEWRCCERISEGRKEEERMRGNVFERSERQRNHEEFEVWKRWRWRDKGMEWRERERN